MKPDEQRLNALIEDEMMAHKEYKSYNFTELARDELKHYQFLLKLRKQKYGY